jgi:hypothetical protein
MVKSNISTTLTENINQDSFLESFFNMNQNDISKCSMFNFKMILFIIFIFILICTLTSILTSIFGTSCCGKCGDNCTCKDDCSCECNFTKETFSNNELYSYKDTINKNYSDYQSTALTAPTTDDGNPSNLMFGQATRTFYIKEDGTSELFLQVLCNLNIINGNPFGESSVTLDKKVSQKYLVYIKKGSEVELLDQLLMDNDHVYKLKLRIKNSDKIKRILDYNELQIVYVINGLETIILSGKFSLQ